MGRKLVETTCMFCNVRFGARADYVRKGWGRFCSKDCGYKAAFEKVRLRIEKEHNNKLAELLRTRYVIERATIKQLCKELNCHNRTIPKLLKYYDISVRDNSERVVVQWIDNKKRREVARKVISKKLKGKISPKRLKASVIKKRMEDNDMLFLGIVVKNHETRALYKCKKCNHESEIRAASLGVKGCSNCKESKGEKQINDCLESNNLKFKRQFWFDDCRATLPLPFDFVVFNEDEIICAIEYDGEQHYKVIPHFGGEAGLQKRKNRDEIKTNYCKENNIPLIRIPYWEFDNISQILDKEISGLNKEVQLSLM
ncbi:Uncharacterized protein BWINRA5_00052 [Bacillus mycoides]|uniref:DUF2726 domain-containing protein n=1 Tax=Bacillus mycoides TaxID=1405 RepID=UPI0008173020|nr:DUF2726 domain-containing protein [Bacillus mycoides]SCA96737.1 Uncharacterized protein BWINRA5_00052 [Bacillus mycoides]